MRSPALIGFVAFSILIARGQSPESVEFEVASVKPAVSRPNPLEAMLGPDIDDDRGFDGGPGTKDPDRINYHEVTLRALLSRAYDVKSFQISGPGWLATERYVISANVSHGTDAARLRLMLQKLLAERFQVSLHRERKVMAVYQLTVATSGPKLKPVAEEVRVDRDDAERNAASRARMSAMMEATKAQIAKLHRRANVTGFSLFRATSQQLAQKLSSRLDRPVVDMTELKGLYDFLLNWTEDTVHSPGVDTPSQPGPSIFTAIQEQLGLKLVPARQGLEVLVVDSALKIPTSN